MSKVGMYAGYAYYRDVIERPAKVALRARQYCESIGKPLLNIGAGTGSSSLRAALIGPTLWGDVNLDIAAPRNVPHGPSTVSYGEATQIPYPDKHFGAVIASHVLEHIDRPDLALAEWARVAHKSFVIVPTWWAPHTWLHPGHRWFIDGEHAWPLWQHRRQMYLLPVSDKGYAPPQCKPSMSPQTAIQHPSRPTHKTSQPKARPRTARRSRSNSGSSSGYPTDLTTRSLPLPSGTPDTSSQSGHQFATEDQLDLEPSPSLAASPATRGPSESPNSVSSLMVVSRDDSDTS